MKGTRAAVVLLAAMQLTCNQAILTAPAGATLTVFANPTFIPASGGVSVISALVVEPAGTVVPDGTVVQFFTTLGRIEEQGRTNDGVARVNLVADSRSGTATVTATSGGAAGDQATAEVTIGSALPARVIVVADPIRILQPRFARIIATVLDANGNPVANVPVVFTVEQIGSAADATERMESRGRPIFTDNNGQAVDELVTSYGELEPAKVVTVTATPAVADAGLTASVEVQIN